MKPCGLCRALTAEAVALSSSGLVARISDAYPSAPGHRLIVPTRHVGRLADLTDDEAAEMWQQAIGALRHSPLLRCADGFTVGVNDGATAGQTVPHVHLHLIPRYCGDVADPRGGIRWVLPDTAAYWATSQETAVG